MYMIYPYPISINKTTIETGMWHIQRCLLNKYGLEQSNRDMAPLQWYINTGRAPLDFMIKLFAAKPFMVARKLHQGGSYDDVIQRVKEYIGFN